MSESLRNDGRVWVPKNKADVKKHPGEIPEDARDYFLERKYPAFGNLVPRDVASRNAKMMCDEGRGVGASGLAVYLDFGAAIKRDGKPVIAEKYGNLFHMYHEITDEDPYQVPMRIYPAVHYTMGGLWVDYSLMTTIPGLFAAGEANFSDHGANRLGASALMQGLADGYFVLPYTIGNYIGGTKFEKVDTKHPAFDQTEKDVKAYVQRLVDTGSRGTKSVMDYYRELGKIMWDDVGMARNEKGLKQAISQIRSLGADFWKNAKLPTETHQFNKYLEIAGRTADFIELGELMARDALHREESCGGHFREEHQTPEGEAARNDDKFAYVAAWEWKGENQEPVLHKEDLKFEAVKLAQRSYK
jgi:succinate dehydrogenase / fumarate reductase flavoprotein subunit